MAGSTNGERQLTQIALIYVQLGCLNTAKCKCEQTQRVEDKGPDSRARRQRIALERRPRKQGREIQKDEISRVRVWCFHLEPRLAIYYANNPFHPASLGV